MTIYQKIEETFNALKKTIGWGVDKRVILSLAGYYVTVGKEFNEERYKEIEACIKKKTGMFSPLRAHLKPLFIAVLDVGELTPELVVDLLLEKVEALKKSSFKVNNYSYLAALLMADDKEKWSYETERAQQLMTEMKNHHRFLTSSDDYPYAMFLGKLEGDIAVRAETMNRYYRELRKHNFYSGNELQWMSQTLTYASPNYEEELVQRAVIIRDGLKSVKIKTSALQYPVIGFMAVLKMDEDQLNAIVSTYQSLINMKLFSWYKESALPISLGWEIRMSKDAYATTAVSMAASLEMLFQAQQAMMISTLAATSAAASSSNSN